MPRILSKKSLDIYITESCFGCERARKIVAQVRSWDLPHVNIRLYDLGDPETERPEAVFAVPTYLLNGRVVSLGNIDVSRLYSLLTTESRADI